MKYDYRQLFELWTGVKDNTLKASDIDMLRNVFRLHNIELTSSTPKTTILRELNTLIELYKNGNCLLTDLFCKMVSAAEQGDADKTQNLVGEVSSLCGYSNIDDYLSDLSVSDWNTYATLFKGLHGIELTDEDRLDNLSNS